MGLHGTLSRVTTAVIGALLWGCVMVFLTHRGTRIAVGWGALWGLAAGCWIFEPWMLNIHHLRPIGFRQWAIAECSFFVVFVSLGALLALITATPRGAWALLRKRDFRSVDLAYAAWSALWLPPTYLALAALIEWKSFGHALHWHGTVLTTALSWCAVTTLGSVSIAHSGSSNHEGRYSTLRVVVITFTIAGLAVVPFRLTAQEPIQSLPPAPLIARTSHGQLPLLVIGLDGGSWRVLKPVIDAGRAPTLAALIDTGLAGSLPSLWPPYWSAPAWGAIVTGHSQEEIGVHEDLAAVAAGLPPFELPLTPTPGLTPLFLIELMLVQSHVIEPMPTPRDGLHATPVWERLTNAGVRTAVIRFPFTYPADRQATYVVSNRVVVDLWDVFGVRPGEPDKVIRTGDNVDLLSIFSDAAVPHPQLLSTVLGRPDWPHPRDTVMNPVTVLQRVLDNDQRMNLAMTRLLQKDPHIAVVMMHVASLDELSHAFWQYRFPQDFPNDPPSSEDIAQLGPVIDRYIETLDANLREIIRAFPTRPNVLIVADHGEGPSSAYPPWKGWHASPGVFIASGPDIAHSSEAPDVSFYDITPTIIDLAGFEPASDLTGHSVVGRAR
jgi:hypothetical protein